MTMAPLIGKPLLRASASSTARSSAPVRPLPPWRSPGQQLPGSRLITPSQHSLLQRKCACGAQTAGRGACAPCAEKERLQRKPASATVVSAERRVVHQAFGPAAPAAAVPVRPHGVAPHESQDLHEVPASVERTLRRSGWPLESSVRQDMEQRFAHDFSHVRIHRDEPAAQSAHDVGARAYTVGSHVVFGTGQYRPKTGDGRFTLAHELAHVVQQQGGSGTFARLTSGSAGIRIGRPDDGAEREADRAAETALGAPLAGPRVPVRLGGDDVPVLRRRLIINANDLVPMAAGVVGMPTPLTIAVNGLMRDMCPAGNFRADPGTGIVAAPATDLLCNWHPPMLPPPVGCQCLCDVIGNAMTTTVRYVPGGPGAAPRSQPIGPGVPGSGGLGTDSNVNIDPNFQGQYLINGNWVDVPFHLLFSHELCGHALPKMQGTHAYRGATPAGGTPPHEQHAVDVERQIAAEHNPPLPRRPDDYSGAARQRP